MHATALCGSAASVEPRSGIGHPNTGDVRSTFPAVPGLRHSTGAYLLGLLPPEVLALAGGTVRPLRRDPHYVLPTLDGPYLWFGSDRDATRAQLERMFTAADDALQAELAALREELAPAWLAEPLPVEDTADRSRTPPDCPGCTPEAPAVIRRDR